MSKKKAARLSRHSNRSSGPASALIPADLRQRLEQARLESLAFIRALDQIFDSLAPLPQGALRRFFELDADCAEALWALDQPPSRFNVALMVRDTLASLEALPRAREQVLEELEPEDREEMRSLLPTADQWVSPEEAYNDVPGRDPRVRNRK